MIKRLLTGVLIIKILGHIFLAFLKRGHHRVGSEIRCGPKSVIGADGNWHSD